MRSRCLLRQTLGGFETFQSKVLEIKNISSNISLTQMKWHAPRFKSNSLLSQTHGRLAASIIDHCGVALAHPTFSGATPEHLAGFQASIKEKMIDQRGTQRLDGSLKQYWGRKLQVYSIVHYVYIIAALRTCRLGE